MRRKREAMVQLPLRGRRTLEVPLRWLEEPRREEVKDSMDKFTYRLTFESGDGDIAVAERMDWGDEPGTYEFYVGDRLVARHRHVRSVTVETESRSNSIDISGNRIVA